MKYKMYKFESFSIFIMLPSIRNLLILSITNTYISVISVTNPHINQKMIETKRFAIQLIGPKLNNFPLHIALCYALVI